MQSNITNTSFEKRKILIFVVFFVMVILEAVVCGVFALESIIL